MSRVGLILDAEKISDIVDLSEKAESAGFDSIWTTELYRTSFEQLSVAAHSTDKINLGTAVALAFVRSPLITSLTALDLDEISNGRMILGLGSGAMRTNENFHGIKYGKPVGRIRECIELIRLITGSFNKKEPLIYEGEYYGINLRGYHRPFKPIREKIPIYLAGIGEYMTQAAAELADGYLGHVVCSLKYLREVLSQSIKSGLEKSKRDLKSFQRASIICCAVSKNKKDAMRAARGTIAFYATVRTYQSPFLLHGFEKETQRIREAYFKGDVESMLSHVTDEMVNAFSVFGDADECRKRIDEYRNYIDLPILSAPHYFLDFQEVRQLQENIFEAFGE
ncbi:MAG: LLM class flavin-dependent oxidoreductase [Thermodesulfobacteriota bacterium]